MSDDPTRRLPSTRPVVGEPDVAYVSDEALWREHIHDRLRSLTTAVTLAAIVALAALGVALWGLFADPSEDGSTDRVRRLEQRVERLDARLQQRPAAEDVVAIRERHQSLDGIRRIWRNLAHHRKHMRVLADWTSPTICDDVALAGHLDSHLG